MPDTTVRCTRHRKIVRLSPPEGIRHQSDLSECGSQQYQVTETRTVNRETACAELIRLRVVMRDGAPDH